MDLIKRDLDNIPEQTKDAIITITRTLKNLSPKLQAIRDSLQCSDGKDQDSSIVNNNSEVFSLCESQITKCSQLMVDIFKIEVEYDIILQESRLWIIQRLKWCLDKLNDLKSNNDVGDDENLENNFIYWVDTSLNLTETFEKLFLESWNIEKHKNTQNGAWKTQCLNEMQKVCESFKELICSAMNICQYSAETDKKIIKARCQVVLREAKNLVMEMVDDKRVVNDLNFAHLRSEDLRNDLHFPTIALFLNILKESICNLEACINKAILRLVFQSLIVPEEPLNCLKRAVNANKNEDLNDLKEVTEFDFHTEKLTLIGLFAISCSADKQRVTSLKSCIASLESIESQLVPSILLDVNNPHCEVVMRHWLSEIYLLRMVVFLIVDHTAFLEMAIEEFKCNFNELSNEGLLTVKSVQVFIQIGKGVLDYVKVYLENEPTVFSHLEDVTTLTEDLSKVINECKAAADVLLLIDKEAFSSVSRDEQCNKNARMLKRLKLLFTLISKVCTKVIDKSDLNISDETNSSSSNMDKSDEQIKAGSKNGEKKGFMNLLHCIVKVSNHREGKTVQSSLSRSTIVRVKNDKLHLCRKPAQSNDFSDILNLHFSFLSSGASASSSCIDKLDEFALADISISEKVGARNVEPSPVKQNRSMFYKNMPSKRHNDSLRKRLFVNHIEVNKSKFVLEVPSKSTIVDKLQVESDEVEKMNNSLDLQITHILEQLSGLSNTLSLEKLDINETNKSELKENILRIKVNDSPQKNVLKIKVCDGKENKPETTTKISFMEDCSIDVSFGSNIPTPERLKDLNNLEKRLGELKKFWKK